MCQGQVRCREPSVEPQHHRLERNERGDAVLPALSRLDRHRGRERASGHDLAGAQATGEFGRTATAYHIQLWRGLLG